MRRVVLQDIDGVSYPFQEDYVAWFKQNFPDVPTNWIDDFKRSRHSYLHQYFKSTNNGTSKEFQQYLKEKHMNGADMYTFFMSTLRKFGDSEFFGKSAYEEIATMNRELRESGLRILGVTARCCVTDPDYVFNNAREKTARWNEEMQLGLEEIYYYRGEYKFKILEEIEGEIVCFIEDYPKNLLPFLERGINCVLVGPLPSCERNSKLAEELKAKYGDKLIIADRKKVVDAVELFLKQSQKIKKRL